MQTSALRSKRLLCTHMPCMQCIRSMCTRANSIRIATCHFVKFSTLVFHKICSMLERDAAERERLFECTIARPCLLSLYCGNAVWLQDVHYQIDALFVHLASEKLSRWKLPEGNAEVKACRSATTCTRSNFSTNCSVFEAGHSGQNKGPNPASLLRRTAESSFVLTFPCFLYPSNHKY